MKRYLGLAFWFVLLTVISGYLTASACNLIYGPNSGRVVSNESGCIFSSDCPEYCEFDVCNLGCPRSYYSFCVGVNYCEVYPDCFGNSCI